MATNNHLLGNTASEVLKKIGYGSADVDFATAIGECITASRATGKKSKVVITVDIEVREDLQTVEIRAEVQARTPKLKSPATQMHLDAKGELCSQEDFLLQKWSSGGPQEITSVPDPARGSGRMQAIRPAAAPVAALPAAAPIAALPSAPPIADAKS